MPFEMAAFVWGCTQKASIQLLWPAAETLLSVDERMRFAWVMYHPLTASAVVAGNTTTWKERNT